MLKRPFIASGTFLLVMLLALPLALAPSGGLIAAEKNHGTAPLTSGERTWLQNHPDITVAVSYGWEPISFISENRDIRGIAIDYLHHLESRLGIRFRLVRTADDPTIEKADVLAAVVNLRSLEHTRFSALPKPYLKTPFVIFTRDDAKDIQQLEDLHGKRVAVFKTGVAAESIADAPAPITPTRLPASVP